MSAYVADRECIDTRTAYRDTSATQEGHPTSGTERVPSDRQHEPVERCGQPFFLHGRTCRNMPDHAGRCGDWEYTWPSKKQQEEAGR